MSRSTCRINFQFDCWTPRLRKYASTISGLCKYEISSSIAVLSLWFFFQFHFQIPNFPLTGLRDAVNWRLGTMLSHFYLSSFCLIVYKFIKLGWDLTVCEAYPQVIQRKMSGYEFHYFNVRARGEVGRLALSAANFEFKDLRHTREQWLEIKACEYCIFLINVTS